MELMEAQVDAIRQQHTVALEELSTKCSEEMLKREEMSVEIQRMKRQRVVQPVVSEKEQQAGVETKDAQTQAETALPAPSSESMLRSALTRPEVTTDELQVAIESVEALVSEAKRELQGRRFRERRAAFERLHAAIDADDEGMLEAALAEARRTGVEEEDLEKGAAALQELRALTDEERAAKIARGVRPRRRARHSSL